MTALAQTSDVDPVSGFHFRPAVRTNSKMLLGLYGQSGSGKTFSALRLARGLVGPGGRILMIDTENGRGELYADMIDGGYQVEQLHSPFSAQRYIAALTAAEQAGADCLIIDSASHEWEGTGGVLEQAGEIEARTGKPGLHCWKAPKMQHRLFMLKLLQTPLHVILCLRAKHKSRQIKIGGKTEIVKDDFTTPIQADDFIFEMTAHAEILQDHSIRLTKCSHPQLEPCFPKNGPITEATGRALAEWCKGGVEKTPAGENTGLKAAAGGSDSFRAWWKSATKAERATIDRDAARAIAESADLRMSAALDGGDPFSSPAIEIETSDLAATPVGLAAKAQAALEAKAASVAEIGFDALNQWFGRLSVSDQAIIQPSMAGYIERAKAADAGSEHNAKP